MHRPIVKRIVLICMILCPGAVASKPQSEGASNEDIEFKKVEVRGIVDFVINIFGKWFTVPNSCIDRTAGVYSVTPTVGSTLGGTKITISGYGFSTDFMNGANVVFMGGKKTDTRSPVCLPVNFFGGTLFILCFIA